MKNKIIAISCMLITLLLSIYAIGNNVIYAEEQLQTDCKSSILVDYYTGEVLHSKNCDAKMQVASIVKLMTSLITIERIENNKMSINDKVLVSENASGMGGSQIFLDPHVEYAVEDLLKGVIVASANDGAVALAEHIAGSEQEFVKMMNKRAHELGMTNTLYANSTGLPEPEQYSTAKDCAIILREVYKHKTYLAYSNIWMDELIHPSGRKTELVNTNKLIRYYKGCDIGKTGFTDEAGYCLVASAEKNNMRFISCCLGSNDKQKRFNEVSKLFNYGFNNFENKQILSKEKTIGNATVVGSKVNNVNLFPSEDYYVLTKKGTECNVEVKYVKPEKIKAPFKAGDQLAKVLIIKDGNIIKEIALVSDIDANKLTYKDALEKISNNW